MRQFLARILEEGTERDSSARVRRLVRILAPLITVYYLYTAVFTAPFDILFRANHVAIFLALVFLLFSPWKKGDKGVSPWDVICIIMAVATAVYIQLNAERVLFRWNFSDPVFPLDVLFGGFLILLILEASRRVMGWTLTIIVGFLIAYAFAGPWIPGIFGHRGVSVAQLVEVNYLTTSGIYGIPAKVASILAFPFIIFGSFLKITGAADFFFDLAIRITGRTRGGVAKTAVMASAFFGSLSGSAVANAASTGAITIPLMKKSGYPPVFAAAVETAASTGGVIMPPMMGAVAFLMAEVIGVSYFDIVLVAFIPAIIYFAAVFIQVDSEAVRLGLKGFVPEKLDALPVLLANVAHYFGPIVWLTIRLGQNITPARVALETVLILIVITLLRRKPKMDLKMVADTLEVSVKTNIIVATACSAAGILLGVVFLTGLGAKFSTLIMMLGGNTIFGALLVTMFLALFLGMALDISPTYILTASLAGPALVKLGLPLMSAHLFILYYSAMATVSPPVALTAFTAATIAQANPMAVGWRGWRMAVVGFIVPFAFIYQPALVHFDNPAATILAVVTTVLGIYSFVAGMDGYLIGLRSPIPRAILMANMALFFAPSHIYSLIGLGVLLFFSLFGKMQGRRKQAVLDQEG